MAEKPHKWWKPVGRRAICETMFLINASIKVNNKEWKDMTTRWLSSSSMQTQSFTIGPGCRKPTLPRSLGMCVSMCLRKAHSKKRGHDGKAEKSTGAVVRFPVPAMLWLKLQLPPWRPVGSPFLATGVSLCFSVLLGSATVRICVSRKDDYVMIMWYIIIWQLLYNYV